MPKTICSDFSHINLSISNSQDHVKAGMKKKKKIDKKKQHMLHQIKNPPPIKRRNIIMNRKLCKKLVYSPEYTINISEAETPLYHSDQYQPSIYVPEEQFHEPSKIGKYITMEVLLKMCQMEREENEEKDLLRKMKTFQISSMEEDISIE